MPLHDAHNHLQDAALEPHLERIAASWTDIVGTGGAMVVNGTHPTDWPRVAALAARFPFVRPAYGLHPWDAGEDRPADWLARLAAHLDADPLASVGEIGLDRWILDSARPDDPRLAGVRRAPMKEQVAAFLPQLALAATRDLPVTIHCTQAFGELLPLLRANARPPCGFLLHGYGGPVELVPELIALGAWFSFNPAFLAKTARPPAKCNQIGYTLPGTLSSKLANFRRIPAERLLCETDAPAMLPPQTWRTHKLPPAADGSPINHPGNIESAYAGLAALRGVSLAELTAQIADNFTRFFGPTQS